MNQGWRDTANMGHEGLGLCAQVGSEEWRAQCREDVLIALGGATMELLEDLVLQHKLLGALLHDFCTLRRMSFWRPNLGCCGW